MSRVHRTLVTATILLFGSFRADAADSPSVVRAEHIADGGRIVIDGRLDEAVWRTAVPATEFRQMDPDNGAPATERTEVRVAYDERRLVIGITCFDSQPSGLLANQLQRDQSFDGDDRFMFVLDTFADGRSGYYFEINPAGALGDGLIVPGSGFATNGSVNRSWDGIWNVRVTRNDEGWNAEIDLPFQTLNFDRSASAWGINFQRTVRRKNEEDLWTGFARNQGLTYVAAAGRLEGLRALSQDLGLDIRPYIAASVTAAPGRGSSSTGKGDVGGDVFYNVTPSLRANFTLNTDFAETEVDQRRLNFTQYPLFLPEKRAFFLEGSSFFDFAREPGNAIIPFFSRRIGLDAIGVPQPVTYGAKLTGQAGAFDLGALRVRSGQNGDVNADDSDILRVRRRFLSQSYLGGIYTRRSDGHGPVHETVGTDLVLATSHFLGSQVLEVSSFLLNTTKTTGTDGGMAFGARVSLPNDPWYIRLGARDVQDGYDPALGFVDRRAYRMATADVRYSVRRVRSHVLRRISFESFGEMFVDPKGLVETHRWDLQLFRLELEPGDLIEFHLRPTFERLPQDFAIYRGGVLPAGTDYLFFRRHYQVQTVRRRVVAVTAVFEDGTFYSGTRRQVNGTISIRPRSGWLLSLGSDHNTVQLGDRHFSAVVWRADVDAQFTPWVSLVNTAQYDDVSHALGWQLRFRWITRPGNDVFFVYTHNWIDRGGLTTFDRRGALKIVNTLRF